MLIKVKNRSSKSNSPSISLRVSQTIGYSTKLIDDVRRDLSGAGILSSLKPLCVEYFVDPDSYQLHFKFTLEPTEDSFQILNALKSDAYSSSVGLYQEFPFCRPLNATTQFSVSKVKRGWYCCDLAPVFSNTTPRSEILNLDRSKTGIYRVIDGEEIVYFGRGRFAERFREPERLDWEYDRIDYVEVVDVENQKKWERHFLETYVKANGGLPRYNKIRA